jgi:hypothetical protein
VQLTEAIWYTTFAAFNPSKPPISPIFVRFSDIIVNSLPVRALVPAQQLDCYFLNLKLFQNIFIVV